MLTIHAHQFAALAAQARRTYMRTLAALCREQFSEQVETLNEPDLLAKVTQAAQRAADAYELNGALDLQRFVSLAAEHGWSFDEQAENAWMLSRFLENARVSSPSERLELLVEELQHRAQVAADNAKLRAGFGLS
jgi:uncharacterized protein YpbB